MDCHAALAMTHHYLRHCEESSTRQSMPSGKHCENHGLPRCARNDVSVTASSRITHYASLFCIILKPKMDFTHSLTCRAALAMTHHYISHCEESSTWQSMPLSTIVRTMDFTQSLTCRAALVMTLMVMLRHPSRITHHASLVTRHASRITFRKNKPP